MKANAWLFVTTAIYLVTLFSLRQHPEWDPKLRVGLTLLPLLPGMIYLWVLWSTFKGLDELQRRIHFELHKAEKED